MQGEGCRGLIRVSDHRHLRGHRINNSRFRGLIFYNLLNRISVCHGKGVVSFRIKGKISFSSSIMYRNREGGRGRAWLRGRIR
jgi:hypothetical protein